MNSKINHNIENLLSSGSICKIMKISRSTLLRRKRTGEIQEIKIDNKPFYLNPKKDQDGK